MIHSLTYVNLYGSSFPVINHLCIALYSFILELTEKYYTLKVNAGFSSDDAMKQMFENIEFYQKLYWTKFNPIFGTHTDITMFAQLNLTEEEMYMTIEALSIRKETIPIESQEASDAIIQELRYVIDERKKFLPIS